MSSDETSKIEPILTNAPSIAPEAKPEAAEIIAPKTEPEALKPEAPIEAKTEARVEPEKIEPKIEKIEPKLEGPTLPPAAQIEPPRTVIALRRPEPKAEKPATPQPRSRFALLAACVAIAASLGAIGGSLGVAKFGPMMWRAPQPQAIAAAKDHTADEIKALKESLAQLRANTKAVNDNLAALKTSLTATSSAQNAQIGKIAETLDRVEKTQTEQRKTAAATQMTSTTQAVAASETTGSIQKTPVPMVLGDPPTTLKPPVLHDYVVRRVYDGAALIEGRSGIIEVEPGIVVPGLGRIEAIKRQDGRWVVVTARGLVVQR